MRLYLGNFIRDKALEGLRRHKRAHRKIRRKRRQTFFFCLLTSSLAFSSLLQPSYAFYSLLISSHIYIYITPKTRKIRLISRGYKKATVRESSNAYPTGTSPVRE